MQALDDDDRANIEQTIDDEVLRRDQITFRSTDVAPAGDGLRVKGDLTLLGHTRAGLARRRRRRRRGADAPPPSSARPTSG